MPADPTRDEATISMLSRVFDESDTPMLITDESSVCVEVNKAACEFFGRSRGETIGEKTDDLTSQVGERLMKSTTTDLSPGRHLVILMTPAMSGEASSGASGREPLSKRELEVLELLAGGANNNEVAEALGISPETVRNHTRSARRKLGARSRSHAIALAIALGQLELTLDA